MNSVGAQADGCGTHLPPFLLLLQPGSRENSCWPSLESLPWVHVCLNRIAGWALSATRARCWLPSGLHICTRALMNRHAARLLRITSGAVMCTRLQVV